MTGGARPRARRWTIATWLIAMVAGACPRAFAQIDPLLSLKSLPPNVIIVLDTSASMLADGNGTTYDVKTYRRADDPAVADALGVKAAEYRRMYRGLAPAAANGDGVKYDAADIVAVPSDAPDYAAFWAPTRFEIARTGLARAVAANPTLVRWGLVKLRQNGAAWRDRSSPTDCDGPVRVIADLSLANTADVSPCAPGAAGVSNLYAIDLPRVSGPNADVASAAAGGAVLDSPGTGHAAAIQTLLDQPIGTGPIVPAGADTSTDMDRPIYNALADARAEAAAAFVADDPATAACRNTVVVLIAGGQDDGDAAYRSHGAMAVLAASFASMPVAGANRRVPIVVVGVNPSAGDEPALQAIAAASGGAYFRASTSDAVAAAVNAGVQIGFSRRADVDAARPSEFLLVSPVVGTVDLDGAMDARGATLPNTTLSIAAGPNRGKPIPQPGNAIVTAGFALPGFDGRVRAFRAFVPTADATAPSGWTFMKDGTRLWPDLDDRPSLAGLARTPIAPDARNVYTFLPDGAGGGRVVSFTLANAAALASSLGGADPQVLIPFIRAQPIGAVIGSTPAIMSPPAIDPAPDAAYGAPDAPGTFAGDHRARRAIVFFGANDGMVHAVDARTGYEVWAFIPYNLLPKLKTLMSGEPVERFNYFVDGSPKIADVKIGGAWRTLLVIGEGYGGTCYQAFDVTDAGMGIDPAADTLGAVNALLESFADPGRIAVLWAFPSYSSFDPSIVYTDDALGSAFPGGRVSLFGDLRSSASNAEKRVGFTFSDPVVAPLAADRSVTAVIVGSGYFPNVESALPGRGASIAAGHALFVLDAGTGSLVGDPTGACDGTGCLDVGDADNGRKNALQADPTAVVDARVGAVDAVYDGDVDGRYWRFSIAPSGAIGAHALVETTQPIFSSSALATAGGTDRYLFFATGSDALPAGAPGGDSGSGSFRLYGVEDGATSDVVFTQSLAAPVGSGAAANGERPANAPVVAGDIVFFTTTALVAGAPACDDAETKVYAFTYAGTPAYDTNGNGRLDPGESAVVLTTSGRATAPFVRDRHVYVGVTSAAGAGVTVLGDPAGYDSAATATGVRVLSWRELR